MRAHCAVKAAGDGRAVSRTTPQPVIVAVGSVRRRQAEQTLPRQLTSGGGGGGGGEGGRERTKKRETQREGQRQRCTKLRERETDTRRGNTEELLKLVCKETKKNNHKKQRERESE